MIFISPWALSRTKKLLIRHHNPPPRGAAGATAEGLLGGMRCALRVGMRSSGNKTAVGKEAVHGRGSRWASVWHEASGDGVVAPSDTNGRGVAVVARVRR